MTLLREVFSIIVSKMIVRNTRLRLDSSREQEINKVCLELCLTSFEVISDHEAWCIHLEKSRNESVLRRTIDEGDTFKSRGQGKDGRRRNLFVVLVNGFEKIGQCIMNARNDLAESFSVGCPQDNDLVQGVHLLEVSDVGSDNFQILFFPITLNNIVSSLILVGSNEIRIINGGQRSHLLHVRVQFLLEVEIKDFCPFHAVSQVQIRYVPPTKSHVSWINKRQNLRELGKYFLLFSASYLQAGRLGQ